MTNNKNIRHTFNNIIVIIVVHILAYGSSVVIGLGTPRHVRTSYSHHHDTYGTSCYALHDDGNDDDDRFAPPSIIIIINITIVIVPINIIIKHTNYYLINNIYHCHHQRQLMIGKERKLEYDILCTNNHNMIKVSPKDEHTSTTCVSTKGEVITIRSPNFKLNMMMNVPTIFVIRVLK